MPARDDLDYINLSDFTPGIFSDIFAGASGVGTQPAPEGAAQEAGTWGCVASPVGGLIPGPRRVKQITETPFDTPFEPGYYPSPPFTRIVAMRVISPITLGTAGATNITEGVPRYPCAVFITHQYYFDSTGIGATTTFKERCRVYKMNRVDDLLASVPTTFDLVTQSGAGISKTANTPYDSYGLSWLGSTRSNKTTPTSPGNAVLGFASGILGGIWAKAYPSNATPSADSVDTIATTGMTVDVQNIVGHQNRFVMVGNPVAASSAFGLNMVLAGAEAVFYTNPNDYSTAGSLVGAVFFPENVGGIGAMHSMNASTLIVIKTAQGGYVINGDIGNPSITQLPGLQPTLGAGNEGCIIGGAEYVYGSRNGVYSWTGGDVSQPLAPQLDGWFWQTPLMTRQGPMQARFTYVYPYLYAPNNWIMDTRTRSWWKLTSPNDVIFSYWDSQAAVPSALGSAPCAVGSPNMWTPQQPVVAAWYTAEQGQSYYTWTSQPYQKCAGRLLEARELEACLQGVGTVTVTIIGKNGVVMQPWVIAVNSPNEPVYITATCGGVGAQCNDPVINIQSQAANPNGPAPRWVRGRVGYRELMTVK